MQKILEDGQYGYAIVKNKIYHVQLKFLPNYSGFCKTNYSPDDMIPIKDNEKNSEILIPLKDIFDDYNTAFAELQNRLIANPERPSWDEYFMNIAKAVATRSSCSRRKVGAIIVKDRRIITTGYNGTPKGIKNCNEGGCPRCSSDTPSGTKLDECTCSHGEENAIVQAAYHGISTKGGVLYVTFTPCLNCAKMLINAGIREVVYDEHYSVDQKASELLQEAGVILRRPM